MVHHKHYVNGGTLAGARDRVDALCAHLNGVGGPAFSREAGKRLPKCQWM